MEPPHFAHREFGRVLRASGPKIVLSGAARHADKAAGEGYFVDSSIESADRGTRWRGGLPRNDREVRQLIARMARRNFLRRAARIHGELTPRPGLEG